MANGKSVTITVNVKDGDSEKTVRRLTDSFEKAEAAARRASQASSSLTDKDIFSKAAESSRKFLNEMINSGGMRQYQEVLRQFAPELRTLQQELKSGSFNQEDFNRRISSMPPLLQKAMRDVSGLGKNIKSFGDETEHGTNGLQRMLISADLTGRAIAFLTQKIAEGWSEYQNYGRELAKIDTILGENGNVDKYRDQILQLKPELGSATELAKGLYLALGSDIAPDDSMQFLVESAKAAKAGVADLEGTIDASTTILASYNLQVKDTSKVYDQMFEVVNRGKIEMPQLAQSIGQVTSVAAIAGVKLEELFAAVATATLTNKPSVAIEGLRSAISNIIKPSQQAVDLAESLGLEFSAAALKSKGLAQFLQEVSDKTGNSAEKLAVLFGDVQGFNIVATLAGQNADKFADNLEAMGNAAGNVDKAFAKQQQSLGVQFDTFINRITKGFVSAFSTSEPIIKIVLSVLNTLLPVIIAVTVATGGLAAAWLLLNTQLFTSAVAGIGTAVTALQVLYVTLLEVVAGTATLQATLAIATGGLALVGAAVGLAVYAYSNMETAIDRANKITLDSVDSNVQALESYRQLAVQADGVASAQTGSAERHEKLNAVLDRLDPTTQEYINSLKDEEVQIKALTDKISENIEVQKSLLESKLRTVAEGILESKNSLDEENKSILANQETINKLTETLQFWQKIEQEGSLNRSDTILKIGETRIKLDILAKSNTAAGEEVRNFTKSLQENELKLINTAQGLNLNNEQLRQFFTNAGYSKNQVDLLTAAYSKATGTQQTFADRTDNATDAVNQQTSAIKSLRDQFKGLISDTQARIDEKVTMAAAMAKNKAEAQNWAKFLMVVSPELQRDIKEVKRLTENEKAAREVFQPSERSGGQSSIQRTKKDAVEAKKAVKDLRTELGDLSSVLDAMRKGTMMQESGGNINARNDRTGALSLFQVMPANVAPWTKEYLGKTLSLSAFKKDVDAQISVFNGEMGKYLSVAIKRSGGDVKKAIRMAAAAWYGGEGAMHRYDDPTKFRKNEPSFREYTSKVLQRTMNSAATGGKSLGVREFDVEASNLNRILELQTRITEIKKNGLQDEKFQQELQLAQIELEKRETEEILKLRRELNYQITDPLPQAAEDRADSIKVLQEYKRNAEQIESIVDVINEKLFEQGVTTTVGVRPLDSPEDAKKQLEQWQSVNKSLDSFSQTSQNARKQIIELAAEFDDGLTPLERFDLEIKELEKSGKITAEVFQSTLKPIIEQTRAELDLVAKLEWSKKLREDAKAVTESIAQMTEDVRGQLSDLNTTEETRPFADFIKQIQQINGLDLPTDALTELQSAISSEGINTEKLAEIVRYWLTLSSVVGGTDASEIDSIIEKLTLAAKSVNTLTDAQRKSQNDADYKSFGDGLQEEYQELLRNGEAITRYEEVLKQLETTYKNLDPVQKNQLLLQAAMVDSQEEFNRKYNETYDIIRSTFDTLLNTSQTWSQKLKSIFSSILDGFTNMLSDMAAKWATSAIVGSGSGNQSGSSGGGGFFGNLIGSIFGGFGGGKSASFAPALALAGGGGTSPIGDIAKSITSQVRNDTLQTTSVFSKSGVGSSGHEAIHSGIASAIGGGKFSFSNIGKSLGSMAPMLGLSLGSGLGGNSMLGQILGGAGGLLGGVAAGIGTGALGTSGGLLGGLVSSLGVAGATGVFAAVAVPLLIGAWLIGRNTLRRQEEQTRNQLSLDSYKQIEDLIKQVNLDKMDGQSALAQAAQVRENYLAQANQLKDAKTRRHAVQQVRDVDWRIDSLKQAAAAQDQRKEVGSQLSAEFNTGGVIRGFADGGTSHKMFADQMKYLPKNFSGHIPGYFDKKDDILMAVSRGETAIVMTPEQWAVAGNAITPALQKAKVPGFNEGGSPTPIRFPNSSPNFGEQKITLVIENIEFPVEATVDAEGITLEGLNSRKVKGKIYTDVKIKDRDGF